MVISLGLLACADVTGPVEPESPAFGTISVVVDGEAWVSHVFPDSFVAFYHGEGNGFRIDGMAFESPDGRRVRHAVQVLFLDVPAPGPYPIGDEYTSVVGFLVRPPSYRPRGFSPEPRAYLSAGRSGDEVVLDEFDLGARRIVGRFAFRGRKLNGVEEVTVRGRFAGRIAVPVPPPE